MWGAERSEAGSGPCDAGGVFRAGAEGPFLAAADLPGGQAAAGPHDQSADALGGVDLMAGEGVGIRPALPHVKGHPKEALHPVHMEQGPGTEPVPQGGNFPDGHDGPGLVVDLHDADQPDLFVQHPLELFQ